MQKLNRIKARRFPLAAIGLVLLLVAVACGSAAAPPGDVPEQADQPEVKDVVTEAAKEAQKETAAEKETQQKEQNVAVATPNPTPVPEQAGVMEKREQITILQSSFGNEIFNSRYISGDKGLWWYPLQERMINSNENLELTNKGIVTNWELTDGGLGWEYTIRDDATFHSGEPVTPEDLAFSFQWGFTIEATSRVRQRIVQIIDQHAEATGPNTMKILFSQPYAALPGYTSEQVASGGSAAIVHDKSYFDEVGTDGYEADPDPGAAGPFQLVEHRRGEEVLYEVWDDHFRKDREYAFDRLSVQLVPEQSTQLAALRTGAADIIPADLTVIDQIRNAGARVVFAPQSTVIWINANSCSKEQPQQTAGAGFGLDLQGRELMCSDQRVRYALDYAIDKEAIQAFFGGPEVFQIKGTAAVAPASLGYGPGLDPFPYDPEKARQLLAEAGFPDGEGFNYGEPFQVWTWPAGATAPRIVEMAELVCSMWEKELNFECEVNVGEEISIKDKQYTGGIPGQYLVRSNEHDYDVGSKYKGRFGTPQGSYISYDSSLQAVIDETLAVVDPQKRADAYYEMHKAVHEKHYDFAPGYLNAPYGVANDIVEWKPWPMKVHPTALWTIRFAQP